MSMSEEALRGEIMPADHGALMPYTPAPTRAPDLIINSPDAGRGVNVIGQLMLVGGVSAAIIVVGTGAIVLMNVATGVVIAAGVSMAGLASAIGFLNHQFGRTESALKGQPIAEVMPQTAPSRGLFGLRGPNTNIQATDNRQWNDNRVDKSRRQSHDPQAKAGIFGRATAIGHQEIHNHESPAKYYFWGAIIIGVLAAGGYAAWANQPISPTEYQRSLLAHKARERSMGDVKPITLSVRVMVCTRNGQQPSLSEYRKLNEGYYRMLGRKNGAPPPPILVKIGNRMCAY